MSGKANGASEHVLMIEESYIQGFALRKMLEKEGFRNIDFVRSIRKLKEKIVAEQPDLVFIPTLLRGDNDGIRHIQEIRGRFSGWVIFMTSRQDPEHLRRIRSVWNSLVLFKPIQYRQLREVLTQFKRIRIARLRRK